MPCKWSGEFLPLHHPGPFGTWLASQDAAAVPEEDVGREDADRSVAQALLNQLLPRPPLNLQQSLHQHLFRPLLHHLYSPLLPQTYSFKHPNYHLPPTHHLKLLHYQRSHLHLHHHLHCHRLHLQHHLKWHLWIKNKSRRHTFCVLAAYSSYIPEIFNYTQKVINVNCFKISLIYETISLS